MKKLFKIASLITLLSLGICLAACNDSSDENDENTIIENLPGTSGGESNPNDNFAGKTFYDTANESTATKKYVFATNGTYIYSEIDEEEYEEEYRYSLSNDGKTFYAAVNKVSFNMSGEEGSGTLMTYKEIKDFVNSEKATTAAEQLWKNMPEEGKENLSFEDFWKKFKEEILESIKEYFSGIYTYTIIKTTAIAGSLDIFLLEQLDSSSKDLSKMSFAGYFLNSNPFVIIDGHSAEAEISSKYYKTSKIDSSKLYFEEDEETDTFEATYTVTGSGNETKITVKSEDNGLDVTLSFTPDSISLYESN